MLRAFVKDRDRVQDRGSGRQDRREPTGGVTGEAPGRRGLFLEPGGGRGRVFWLAGAALGLGLGLGISGCAKDPEIQAVTLTKEVDAALAQQKWELAEKKAQDIVNLPKLSDVSRDQAKLKVEQARSEQQARLQYQKFVGYVNSEYDTAIAAYRDMPESSYYRQQARADYDRIRPSFIEDHLTRAQSALGGGRCEDVKAQLQLVLDVDPQNSKAIEIGKKPCGKKQ